MKMWFTPMKRNDARSMRLKALSVADVVAANGEVGYEWIEQMMSDVRNNVWLLLKIFVRHPESI